MKQTMDPANELQPGTTATATCPKPKPAVASSPKPKPAVAPAMPSAPVSSSPKPKPAVASSPKPKPAMASRPSGNPSGGVARLAPFDVYKRIDIAKGSASKEEFVAVEGMRSKPVAKKRLINIFPGCAREL